MAKRCGQFPEVKPQDISCLPGITSLEQRPPTPSERVTGGRLAAKIFLVYSRSPSIHRKKQEQFEFFFGEAGLLNSNVQRFVTKNRYPYLDYAVVHLFSDEKELMPALKRLKRCGVVLVGQLVQRTEEDLRRLPFIGDNEISEINRALASVDLTLGMRATRWSAPASAYR